MGPSNCTSSNSNWNGCAYRADATSFQRSNSTLATGCYGQNRLVIPEETAVLGLLYVERGTRPRIFLPCLISSVFRSFNRVELDKRRLTISSNEHSTGDGAVHLWVVIRWPTSP